MENKVGLLLLDSHNYNYGGLLQGYALEKTIDSFGFNCEVINYDISSELNTFSIKRSLKYITIDKIIKKAEKVFKRSDDLKPRDPAVVKIINERQEKFDKFCEDRMKFSPRYIEADLNALKDKYEIFVCGSDQIWNPEFSRPSYFLNFASGKNRVIYAASIGREKLSKIEKKTYRKYLKGLKWISVREQSAKELLQPETSSDIEVVLDPTLLIDPEEWKSIAGINRIVNDNYMFCYFLSIDKEKIDAAKSLSAEMGLKIVSIPYLCDDSDLLYEELPEPDSSIGPEDFLNLVLYANFVLTDSFHGSVFSILFGKNFRVFPRGSGRTNMNTRIVTLLTYIDKMEFLIGPDEISAESVIDSEYTLDTLLNKREASLSWLKDALNDG